MQPDQLDAWLLAAPWLSARVPLVLVLGTTAAFVAAYYGLTPARLQPATTNAADDQGWGVVRARCVQGTLFLVAAVALVPLSGIAWSDTLLGVPDLARSAVGMAVLAVVLLGASLPAAGKPAMLARYPDIRIRPFGGIWRLRSAAAWALYLLGYEALFRGVLVAGLATVWDPVTAVVVHTAIYVLAHLHKPAAETVSCFVMGPVFAILAWWTDGFWAPWLLHVIIAVANENASARAAAKSREGGSVSYD